jgi:hypothetical protein
MEQLNNLIEREAILRNTLSEKNQNLIRFKSIRNFLQFYSQLDNEMKKRKVLELIEIYFEKIEKNEFSFQISEKREIIKIYIEPIAYYYIEKFHFKFYINFKYSIFIGLNIDLVLLILGLSKQIHFIPIATLICFGYWVYVKLRFERKNKFY